MKPSRHAVGEHAASPSPVVDATPAADPSNTAPAPTQPSTHRWAEQDPDEIPVASKWIDDANAFTGFAPAPVRPRRGGWSAERQRVFLSVLAETGSISNACEHAGVSSRSAYRLRARADATGFARAWDHALKLAAGRLTAMAFERATRGTVRETFRGGELVEMVRQPSDRLLMFLLQHLLPAGKPGDRWGGFEAMSEGARATFPAALDALTDHALPMVPVQVRDYRDVEPGWQDEDV